MRKPEVSEAHAVQRENEPEGKERGSRGGLGRVPGVAGWIGATLVLAVLLASVALSPASNWTVRSALAGFCILAIARPDGAVLVMMALAGFGIILSHLAGTPDLRVTEVLVAGALAGCCVRAFRSASPLRRALVDRISMPIALFAIVSLASTLVWMRVYQFESSYASAYVGAFLRFLTRDYFVQPGEFWVLVSTFVILEGLALYVAVAALCQVDASFFERGLRMLAVGGAGLAMMSVVRLAEIALRNPGVLGALRAGGALRISPQIPDYIAAGSYFALCWLVAVGLAVAAGWRRWPWVALGLPLLAALYLTGSRSPIGAALAGLAVMAFFVIRRRAAAARAAIAFGVVGLALILSYPWLTGRDIAGELARQSLTVRAELMRTGLRVIGARPLFGVGIDRFHLSAGALASPELRALWPERKNPHNDLLRFGGELGLVGLALFVWILAAAGRWIWQALTRAYDPRLAGLAGGLVAFLVTGLVSNPLMVRDVSYVFWIALGLAVGQAARLQATVDSPPSASRPAGTRWSASRWRLPIGLLLGALVVVSIPFRVRQELATVNLARVSYGLFDWGTEPDGTRCRWSGPRATVFVDDRARAVEIPISGTLPSGASQQVEVRVDGRLANRVAVGPEWRRLRTLIPADAASGPRRIDLLISPSWVPAEVFPGNPDQRVLGVKVGEIKVVETPDQVR